MNSTNNERGFAHLALLLVVALALVVGVGVYVYKSQNTITTTTANNLVHPGVVRSEVFATSLDATGVPVNPTSTFSTTTPNIYVALGLNNTKSTQHVEYTRYLNNKFVDHGSIPVKAGAKYASFNFSLKAGQTRPKGNYVVKTYTNGIFERSTKYTVQ